MPYPRSHPASEDSMVDNSNIDNEYLLNEVEPIREGIMLDSRYQGHHSICQMLRDIYMLTNNEEIKMKTRLATTMAKKMHERLKWYKQKEDNKELLK